MTFPGIGMHTLRRCHQWEISVKYHLTVCIIPLFQFTTVQFIRCRHTDRMKFTEHFLCSVIISIKPLIKDYWHLRQILMYKPGCIQTLYHH